jgi:hypothetical protein
MDLQNIKESIVTNVYHIDGQKNVAFFLVPVIE